MSLTSKSQGYYGIVSHLKGELPVLERLMELGVIPGTPVFLSSRSRFIGSTVIIVNDTAIALREVELQCIQI